MCRVESAFGGEQSPLLSRFDISRREGKARVAARNRLPHTSLSSRVRPIVVGLSCRPREWMAPYPPAPLVAGASRGPRSCLARATRSIPTAPISALMRVGAHAHTRSRARARVTYAWGTLGVSCKFSYTRIFPVEFYYFFLRTYIYVVKIYRKIFYYK